ncbi:MAG TPA: hypothetical protein VGL23_18160 [Chloroflexota bacterium]
MVYRLILAILLVVAVALTLNERWQEQRAHALAEQVGQPAGSSGGATAAAPTPARGPAVSRPVGPFAPHRVRVRQEIELLEAPEAVARPVEPVRKGPPGILVQAVDERNGWYLVDTNLNRGWAPTEVFDEP